MCMLFALIPSRQYHKGILLLYTILLPTLKTTDPRFSTCAHSAASACTAYKRLNQNRTLTYTMISLHSCFVAGLTLIYCIWRDKSLFSYDVLEAVRDCSQSLTIFGEKWPGAVKYRDIFDALSGSLLKTIVNPTQTRSNDATQPLQLGVPAQSTGIMDGSGSQQAQDEAMQAQEVPIEAPMGDLMPETVKEAFMEVDGEAPGGWQGWRMWNQMMSDDATVGSDPSMRPYEGYGALEDEWDPCYAPNLRGSDPMQDAVLQNWSHATMGSDQWGMSLG